MPGIKLKDLMFTGQMFHQLRATPSRPQFLENEYETEKLVNQYKKEIPKSHICDILFKGLFIYERRKEPAHSLVPEPFDFKVCATTTPLHRPQNWGDSTEQKISLPLQINGIMGKEKGKWQKTNEMKEPKR